MTTRGLAPGTSWHESNHPRVALLGHSTKTEEIGFEVNMLMEYVDEEEIRDENIRHQPCYRYFVILQRHDCDNIMSNRA